MFLELIVKNEGGKVVRARLPLMWPGFKSRRRRHMWVEFVVGSLLCSERFFSGYSGFPLSSKTNISKFQFDQESGRRRTIMLMCYLQIVIYFIMYLFKCIRSKTPRIFKSSPPNRLKCIRFVMTF